jgi:outer membrane murein-binding lipoprotein Lpp
MSSYYSQVKPLLKREKCADSKYYTLNKYGGIILMSQLDFLEVSGNLKSYYRTLRDVHYYLTNDSEVSEEELQAVSKVLSKLIYGFIRIKGTSFREMQLEQFEQEFNIFHQDFLNVIQNSGENNVDFDEFTALIDEIIAIAVKRTIALGKIKRAKNQSLIEDVEIDEVNDAESELSNEDEDNDANDGVVVEATEVMDEIIEEELKVENISTKSRTFSTDFEILSTEVETVSAEAETLSSEVETVSTEAEKLSSEVETLSSDVETVSTEAETLSTGVETISPEVDSALDETGNAENEKRDSENKVEGPVVANEVDVAVVKPEKVKNKYVDAAPVGNNLNDYESSDNFRFRPRRRKHR